MSVITLASSKGGPGKTTIAACLASYWTQTKQRVALIDADTTGVLTRWHAKAKAAGNPLGGATAIACVDDGAILTTIREADASHDYVLVDCAGAAARLLVFAAGAADLVVIPAQPGEGDVVEAIRTAKIVGQAGTLTGREISCRVVFNKHDGRTKVGQHAVAEAAKNNLILSTTTWAYRVTYREGQFSGSSPLFDEPKGRAAEEIVALGRELDEALVEKVEIANEVMAHG